MFNPNNEGPISPMKKLKILSEKQQNVQHISSEVVPLKPIKELLNKEKPTNVVEPLLQETANQYVIFPINHDDMWRMYKELVGHFWSVTETIENLDALSLDYNEKMYMKHFASIFASPDSRGLVNDNFAEEFCKVVQVTEAKFFFGHQLFVQNIHYEMYSKLLDNYAQSVEEKLKLFKIVESYESVAAKRSWLAQWKNSTFAEQLLAATCLHGLFFSGLELTVSWLKNRTRNQFSHELVEILERMIYDQQLQRDFSCLMISHLKSKPTNEKMIEVINQAAKIEFQFLLNGLNIDLINMNTDDVIKLIDKNTKSLKYQLFNSVEEKKKTIQSDSQNKAADIKLNSSKENHQKLVFDEDF